MYKKVFCRLSWSFHQNLSKPKQQAVVEEVLEEDSIDEDSEDGKN